MAKRKKGYRRVYDEGTTKKIKYKDGGPKVKQRRGSRKNYDNKTWTPSGLQFPTSESSHLMMAEYDDDIDPSTGKPVGWVGFPSLFQDDKPYANDQDNWIQMSGENGWDSIYEEAKRRGEVYYFGEDKETALAFGEGSWKDQLPDEAIEVELTDKEVEQYRAGGYVLEEMEEGGEGGGTYTVKSGDTFRGIANRLGIPFKDLEKANPGINYDKLSLGQVLNLPEAKSVIEVAAEAAKDTIPVAEQAKAVADKLKDVEEKTSKEDIVIDLEGLKKGISHVESSDGVNMMNPTSSATGLYGQLYNEVKDLLPELKGVTREQFSKDLDLQNKIFEKRFYEGWDGLPSLQSNALELYEEYSPQIKDFNYSYEDIAALSNFLGRQGTREFFASLRDSKEFTPPGINKTPGQYLEGARSYYAPKEEQDGGYVDIELTDEEVEKYKQGGYVVEELPKANLGKIIKQAAKGSGKKVVSTTVKGTKSYIKNLNVKGTSSFKKPLKLNKVSAPKSVPKSFKSEIDWGNWNKTIPNNKKLLQEYREIEYTTKLNGSWMKNVDGSTFQGMPEQFVQQQSKNFKKAFPNVYKQNDKVTPLIHHSRAKFSSFDKAKQLSGAGVAKHGSGIYTIPKPYFDRYVSKDISHVMNPTSSKKVAIGYGDNRYDLYANNPLGEFPLKGRYVERPTGIFPESAPRFTKYRTYNTNYKTDPFAAVVPYSSGVKSAIGNDGMFNMANSDIYKSLLPFIMGTGAASQLYNSAGSGLTYKKGGELRSYEPGGTQDEPTGFAGYMQPADEVDNPLQMWNLMQKDRWSGINENTSKGKSILSEYNNRMGAEFNPNDHWSAITISNAVMANTGAKNKNQIRALGFNPTKSHSGYVSDAFATNADPDYKYNRYKAEKPGSNYSIGDIVVKGRRDGKDVGTSKWSYEDFATHGKGYVSHGDIVVDKGIDDEGEYVILAGGNLGNTYKNKKVYTKKSW